MTDNLNEASTVGQFRSAIAAFIKQRREDKLKGKDDPKTAAKYEYATWLASAAKRASQIQIVTHTLKATHPDARGSSLYQEPDKLASHREVGTHVLRQGFAEDVVGNAAALDVYKFLKVEVQDKPLLDWMRQKDEDLKQALSADTSQAEEWMHSFAGLIRGEQSPVSHSLAKQVYWLVHGEPAADESFQLLQPMVPSSLMHAVDADIRKARFGEENKQARQAFYKKEAHDAPYRDYRGLVARKLGGTKPQNISQLNSERGGINYLLSSLPQPAWRRTGNVKVMHVESVLPGFRWYADGEGRRINDRLWELIHFLRSDPDTVMQTRQARDAMEQPLGLQLALFGAEIQDRMPPGWTRDTDCHLPLCEKLWLDPERIWLELRSNEDDRAEDETFNQAYAWADWPDEVAGRFANWLNSHLRDKGVQGLGDAEYKHWAKQAIVETDWPVSLQRRAGGVAR